MSEPTSSQKTGLFFDSRCLLHHANFNHPEGPARLQRSYETLVNEGYWNRAVHLQLAGSSVLDKFGPKGGKCVYGGDAEGIATTSVDVNPESNAAADTSAEAIALAAVQQELPAFAAALQLHITTTPILQPLAQMEFPLLDSSDFGSAVDVEQWEEQKTQGAGDQGADEVDSETEGDDTVYPACVFVSQDLFVNRFSAAAAGAAASGTAWLATAVAQGLCSNGFALVRPPGHHASPRLSDGFCLLNNVAVALQHARSRCPTLQRVLVVDFDVHHGNGTQQCFQNDPNTLFVSIHQFAKGFFPETGSTTELGEGDGLGSTLNLPLSVSCGDDEYLYAWYRVVQPVARAFAPDMVCISAGFDCLRGDPLGNMTVSPEGLGVLTRTLMQLTPHKTVAVLEGGYNPQVVQEGVKHVVAALMGDTLAPLPATAHDQSKREQQKQMGRLRPFYDMVEKQRKAMGRFWSLDAQPHCPSYLNTSYPDLCAYVRAEAIPQQVQVVLELAVTTDGIVETSVEGILKAPCEDASRSTDVDALANAFTNLAL